MTGIFCDNVVSSWKWEFVILWKNKNLITILTNKPPPPKCQECSQWPRRPQTTAHRPVPSSELHPLSSPQWTRLHQGALLQLHSCCTASTPGLPLTRMFPISHLACTFTSSSCLLKCHLNRRALRDHQHPLLPFLCLLITPNFSC